MKDQLPQGKCCSIAKPPAVVEQYSANVCDTEDIPNISNSKRRKSLIEEKQVQVQGLYEDLKVLDSDRYNATRRRLWAEAINVGWSVSRETTPIGMMQCTTNAKTINMEK